MAKILSQEEIDALLNTVTQPGAAQASDARAVTGAKSGQATVYDFKHPNRVSKDQIRKLENIHDTFANSLGSSLSTIQRSIVDVDLVSVDQITYTEFIMSLKSPSCSYTFRMPPLEGLSVVDFNPALAFAIVDRLFGGRGAALETERELTGIERSVMQRIVVRVLEQLVESWGRVLEASAETVGFETNPQFIQVVPPGETVIVVTLQVNMTQAGGCLTICYPYVTLEGVLDKLATQNWIESTRFGRAEVDREVIEQMIRRLQLPLDGQLAETAITLRELLELEPGMVIPLPLRVGQPVTLRVAGKRKFTGTLGTLGRRRAVQIERPLLMEGE
jgi:flagellar motor switch protein FliM